MIDYLPSTGFLSATYRQISVTSSDEDLTEAPDALPLLMPEERRKHSWTGFQPFKARGTIEFLSKLLSDWLPWIDPRKPWYRRRSSNYSAANHVLLFGYYKTKNPIDQSNASSGNYGGDIQNDFFLVFHCCSNEYFIQEVPRKIEWFHLENKVLCYTQLPWLSPG